MGLRCGGWVGGVVGGFEVWWVGWRYGGWVGGVVGGLEVWWVGWRCSGWVGCLLKALIRRVWLFCLFKIHF